MDEVFAGDLVEFVREHSKDFNAAQFDADRADEDC